jgi:hypothetical protein
MEFCIVSLLCRFENCLMLDYEPEVVGGKNRGKVLRNKASKKKKKLETKK